MAKASMLGSVLEFFFDPLEHDEFIPVVEFDRSKYDVNYGFLSGERVTCTLDKNIDDGLREFEPKLIDTECRKITLPFSVKKGCSKSGDNDGVVDIKLSVTDPEIVITGGASVATNYGSSLEIEIEIKKNSDIEFYVDFYANDNDDKNKGKLKDLHCGRVKVQFTCRTVIVVIVGTDDPSPDHQHKTDDSFVRRVDRLLNTSTIENVVVGPQDYVYVLTPRSMSASNIKKLQSYGGRFKHYEVQTKSAMEVTLFINGLKNIRSLMYFGHGVDTAPLYEYGVAKLPDPSIFQRTSFRTDAIAWFETCNSKKYAEKFATVLGVESVGVEGTTFYGQDEISAGRLTDPSPAGTSIAWRYTYNSSGGVTSGQYSLNQKTGKPFLRKK